MIKSASLKKLFEKFILKDYPHLNNPKEQSEAPKSEECGAQTDSGSLFYIDKKKFDGTGSSTQQVALRLDYLYYWFFQVRTNTSLVLVAQFDWEIIDKKDSITAQIIFKLSSNPEGVKLIFDRSLKKITEHEYKKLDDRDIEIKTELEKLDFKFEEGCPLIIDFGGNHSINISTKTNKKYSLVIEKKIKTELQASSIMRIGVTTTSHEISMETENNDIKIDSFMTPITMQEMIGCFSSMQFIHSSQLQGARSQSMSVVANEIYETVFNLKISKMYLTVELGEKMFTSWSFNNLEINSSKNSLLKSRFIFKSENQFVKLLNKRTVDLSESQAILPLYIASDFWLEELVSQNGMVASNIKMKSVTFESKILKQLLSLKNPNIDDVYEGENSFGQYRMNSKSKIPVSLYLFNLNFSKLLIKCNKIEISKIIIQKGAYFFEIYSFFKELRTKNYSSNDSDSCLACKIIFKRRDAILAQTPDNSDIKISIKNEFNNNSGNIDDESWKRDNESIKQRNYRSTNKFIVIKEEDEDEEDDKEFKIEGEEDTQNLNQRNQQGDSPSKINNEEMNDDHFEQVESKSSDETSNFNEIFNVKIGHLDMYIDLNEIRNQTYSQTGVDDENESQLSNSDQKYQFINLFLPNFIDFSIQIEVKICCSYMVNQLNETQNQSEIIQMGNVDFNDTITNSNFSGKSSLFVNPQQDLLLEAGSVSGENNYYNEVSKNEGSMNILLDLEVEDLNIMEDSTLPELPKVVKPKKDSSRETQEMILNGKLVVYKNCYFNSQTGFKSYSVVGFYFSDTSITIPTRIQSGQVTNHLSNIKQAINDKVFNKSGKKINFQKLDDLSDLALSQRMNSIFIRSDNYIDYLDESIEEVNHKQKNMYSLWEKKSGEVEINNLTMFLYTVEDTKMNLLQYLYGGEFLNDFNAKELKINIRPISKPKQGKEYSNFEINFRSINSNELKLNNLQNIRSYLEDLVDTQSSQFRYSTEFYSEQATSSKNDTQNKEEDDDDDDEEFIEVDDPQTLFSEIFDSERNKSMNSLKLRTTSMTGITIKILYLKGDNTSRYYDIFKYFGLTTNPHQLYMNEMFPQNINPNRIQNLDETPMNPHLTKTPLSFSNLSDETSGFTEVFAVNSIDVNFLVDSSSSEIVFTAFDCGNVKISGTSGTVNFFRNKFINKFNFDFTNTQSGFINRDDLLNKNQQNLDSDFDNNNEQQNDNDDSFEQNILRNHDDDLITNYQNFSKNQNIFILKIEEINIKLIMGEDFVIKTIKTSQENEAEIQRGNRLKEKQIRKGISSYSPHKLDNSFSDIHFQNSGSNDSMKMVNNRFPKYLDLVVSKIIYQSVLENSLLKSQTRIIDITFQDKQSRSGIANGKKNSEMYFGVLRNNSQNTNLMNNGGGSEFSTSTIPQEQNSSFFRQFYPGNPLKMSFGMGEIDEDNQVNHNNNNYSQYFSVYTEYFISSGVKSINRNLNIELFLPDLKIKYMDDQELFWRKMCRDISEPSSGLVKQLLWLMINEISVVHIQSLIIHEHELEVCVEKNGILFDPRSVEVLTVPSVNKQEEIQIRDLRELMVVIFYSRLMEIQTSILEKIRQSLLPSLLLNFRLRKKKWSFLVRRLKDSMIESVYSLKIWQQGMQGVGILSWMRMAT